MTTFSDQDNAPVNSVKYATPKAFNDIKKNAPKEAKGYGNCRPDWTLTGKEPIFSYDLNGNKYFPIAIYFKYGWQQTVLKPFFGDGHPLKGKSLIYHYDNSKYLLDLKNNPGILSTMSFDEEEQKTLLLIANSAVNKERNYVPRSTFNFFPIAYKDVTNGEWKTAFVRFENSGIGSGILQSYQMIVDLHTESQTPLDLENFHMNGFIRLDKEGKRTFETFDNIAKSKSTFNDLPEDIELPTEEECLKYYNNTASVFNDAESFFKAMLSYINK